MANMSYCRFENTLNDLRDCHEALWEPTGKMNTHEKVARLCLMALVTDMFMEMKDHTSDDIENGVSELDD